jgi:hypothetical protein
MSWVKAFGHVLNAAAHAYTGTSDEGTDVKHTLKKRPARKRTGAACCSAKASGAMRPVRPPGDDSSSD